MATDSHGMGIPLPADSTKIHEFPAVARAGFEKVAEVIAGGMTEGMEELAGDAVTREMQNRDLVTGDDARLPRFSTTDDHLAVLLDGGRNETWIGARASDGGPTDWAMHHLARRLGLGPFASDEYLFALTDADRNLTDLAVRATDGQFPDFVIDRLRARILNGSPGASAIAQRTYADIPWSPGSDVFPLKADVKRVATWGSSSMANVEWRVKGWINRAGSECYTGAKSGEIIEQTAARLGAVPALLTLPSNTIPASGAVPVTVANIPITTALRAFTGTLAGVAGTLSYSASPAGYVFTRTSAGSAVKVEPKTPFQPHAASYRDAVTLLWMGKNNMGTANADTTAITLTDACFDWLAPLEKRALVLGHFADTNTPSNSTERAQILRTNAAHKARYGRLFIDVYAYLTGSQVWADTGLTPTAEDRAAQAIGNKPPSLSADNGHMNAAADIAVTDLITARLTELGWY